MKRYVKALSIVMSLTLLSRFLGYVREAAFAAVFGVSTEADAFFAAFFVPETLNLILIAGSLSAAFMPVLIEARSRDPREAWYVASCILNLAAILLAATAVVGILTIDAWLPLLFPGYADGAMRLSMGISLLALPTLPLIGLSGLVGAVLNSVEHFTIPALGPVVADCIVIASIAVSSRVGGIHTVAIGMLIGALVQLLTAFTAMLLLGVKYNTSIDLRHSAVRQTGRLALPLTGYLAVAYSSQLVERRLASALSVGTISAFSYALRLFKLPLAILVGSLVTVIYPHLSSQVQSSDEGAFGETVSRAACVGVLVLTPISAWMTVNAHAVVSLLYGYGQFGESSVALTASILQAYSLALVPAGVRIILERGLYARQDTSTPLLIELANFAVYVYIANQLSIRYDAWGLAMARAISFSMLMLLYWLAISRSSSVTAHMQRIVSDCSRGLLACAMATAVWAAGSVLSEVDGVVLRRWHTGTALLGVVGVAGLVVYLGVLRLLTSSDSQVLNAAWSAVRNLLKQEGQ
jgi:putative peptidoglycan lipid II flippase